MFNAQEQKEIYKNVLSVDGVIIIAIMKLNVYNYGVQKVLIRILLT